MGILRAGLYERVSTDEQVKYGYSVRAQVQTLEEYCQNNNMKVVDHYTDEGVSGGKAAFKRPEMSRLLEDVKAGKIDVIVFTRLDRWFRNVEEYFKVQEVLDAHGVAWRAIHEDYDTTTANGRMAITIFMAIAQNEREKGTERLTTVFGNKRKNKEAWYGPSSMPFGYTTAPDEHGVLRLVKDPELQDAVQDFWDMAVKYENVSKAGRYVNETYGLSRTKKSWFDVVHKEIYKGVCRGVEDYCEPYVSPADWDKLQNRGSIKKTQGGRVYLFTGLIRCPVCGKKMTSTHSKQTRASGEVKEYRSYRCRNKDIHLCPNNKSVFELKTEKWLLNRLELLLRDEIARVELERAKPKPKPKTDVPKLREQLRRLEVVYMSGNKSDAEYLAEAAELKARIAKAEAETAPEAAERDLSKLQELLEVDFRSLYETLDAEDRRRFWRGLIKEIHVDGPDVVGVDFL